MNEYIKNQIEKLVQENKVFLFMKGTPKMPLCGFSGRVIQVLEHFGVEYSYFNVFDDSEIREGIKVYSNWPTIPQLYVNGEFVGGCDIIIEMFEKGNLNELFGNV